MVPDNRATQEYSPAAVEFKTVMNDPFINWVVNATHLFNQTGIVSKDVALRRLNVLQEKIRAAEAAAVAVPLPNYPVTYQQVAHTLTFTNGGLLLVLLYILYVRAKYYMVKRDAQKEIAWMERQDRASRLRQTRRDLNAIYSNPDEFRRRESVPMVTWT